MTLAAAPAVLAALAGGACFVAPLGFVHRDAMRLVGRNNLITAEDLIGLEVGTPAGGPGEMALRMWLSDEGVGWDQVEVVDTRAEDLAGASPRARWTRDLGRAGPGGGLAACGEEECRYIGRSAPPSRRWPW